ncbi:MAG TPA: hypothetical protein VK081_13360 [Planctomycetota bacterium]|nr:hypothetical protein [Planctomycetota bacterium]
MSADLDVTLAMMPAPLAALVRAELAAGNEVVEVGRAVPAPSVIAFVKLAQPVTTRPRASGQGVVFEEGEGALRGGAFRDDAGRFFVLEACAPAPAEGALERFRRSMAIDYEKWHDGVGYDLAALRAATARERQEIEALLLARGVRDWRDVEALAALDSDAARHALRAAFAAGDPAVRLAVQRHAPHLVHEDERTAALVEALRTAELYGGLGEALDEAETFHPQPVIDALFAGVLERDGEVAVLFAALLTFLHGKADSAFDMEQRPYFLRFHTEDRAERVAMVRDLCARLGVAAERYVRGD